MRINVYQVVEGRLACRIINNNYIKTIDLCKDDANHYDSVFRVEFIQNATYVQQLIYEVRGACM